jgi:microcystin-dependent protein
MSQINSNQGAVKASEIAIDTPVGITNSPANQDFLELVERLRRTASDAVMGAGVLVLSTSAIAWSGTALSIPAGATLLARILGEPSGYAASAITINFTDGGGGTIFNVNPNDVLLIELSRAVLSAATPSITLTDGVNGVGTVGQRIVKKDLTTLPTMVDPNDGTPEGLIYIPLCVRPFATTDLWWAMTGIHWAPNTTSYLGQAVSENTIPIGGIIAFHRNGVAPAGTTSNIANNTDLLNAVQALAPGFWPCNGTTIDNLNSPINGLATPNLTGQFVRGHTKSNVASGSATVTLAAANLPAHSHGITNTRSHRHPLIANNATIQAGYSAGVNTSDVKRGKAGKWPNLQMYADTGNDLHLHSIAGTTSYNSSGAGQAAGGGAHINEPQHYTVIYIMRVV